ncbi:MAG: YceD family protein [Verrucomicrobiales bacterium]
MPSSTHTPEGRIIIDLLNFPPDGRDFAGTLEKDIFQLESGGPRPASPLTYRLHVERRGSWLVIEGNVGATFELECVRCLTTFPEQVTLDGYLVEEELIEKTPSLDLTDRIREDILLALPGYPHCDESNVTPRVCVAAGRFLPASSYSPDHASEDEPAKRLDAWSALDQLNLKPPAAKPKPENS